MPACAALAAVVVCCLPAACQTGGPDRASVRNYHGAVGPYPITMHLVRRGTAVSGSYEYPHTHAVLQLSGTWTGSGIRLEELYRGRSHTATIVATPRENGSLDGRWIGRDGRRTLSFHASPERSMARAESGAGEPRTGGLSGGNIRALRSRVAAAPRTPVPATRHGTEGEADRGYLQAVLKGDIDTAYALAESNPGLDPRDAEGRTALAIACTFRNDATGETSFASMEDREAFVRFLLRRGADIDAKDNRGYTPLMHACASWGAGDTIVRVLLGAGADVNARNKYDGTALMVATGKYGHVRTVQLLLDAGANPNLRDKFGRTALYYAREHHATQSIRVLQRAGAQ